MAEYQEGDLLDHIIICSSENELKKMLKRGPKPRNCEALKTIKSNVDVWNNLNSAQRTHDINFQKTENMIIKSTSLENT